MHIWTKTLLLGAVLLALTHFPNTAFSATPVDEILQGSPKAGLCVHLGCGSEANPTLTADLARQSSFLVHGLALDDNSLARARKAIEAQNLLGRAVVEKVQISPLPYLPDLANLVVIENWKNLEAQGMSIGEVERITAPGGAICMFQDGKWTRTVKARPPEIDDWPQPEHGADGNRVSSDRIVRFPVGLRWQDGVPMNFNLWAACRGWVIANGICFTLSTTELENIGPASFSKHKLEEYLTARDAFNGMPLWKVNCETTNDGKALNAFNTAPLVADNQRVYVYKKDRLAALDGRTGNLAQSYPVKNQSARLLLADGVLISSGWEGKAASKDFAGDGLWAPWVHKTPAGSVEAFSAAQGSLKWSISSPAQEMVAADGLVYLLVQTGNPATNQHIAAIDLQTGRERWRVAHTNFTNVSAMNLNCAGQGVLVVSRPKAKANSILSAADGKLLWEITPTDQFWTPMVKGELWHGSKRFEPKSGEVKGRLPTGLYSPVCTPAAVVNSIVTASRGSAYVDIDPPSEGGTQQQGAKHITYAATRGGCIEGAVPANGMFYTSQNFCRCAPGQVPGFVAFGPCGDVPAKTDFEKARPVEKGPGLSAAALVPADKAGWPMYRHDAERSAFARLTLPERLKESWSTEVVTATAGPLADAWSARLSCSLSAPVVSGETTFVSTTEAGQVMALNNTNGKVLWRATLGGRLDTPPTIYGGLCLIGSHDGWVYALRAQDGELAWRTRIAPWERRMVAFGQVESVWPAIGSVLLHNGLAYACAGRTSESDGGLALCAFDPVSGGQKWARQVGPGPVRENDLLLLRDGQINLHHLNFDPASGQGDTNPKGQKDEALEGWIDGTWTRVGTRRSGNLKFGRVSAEMFAWNENILFGYQMGPRSCFAMLKSNTLGTNKVAQQDFVWRSPMPANHQAEAMALCENGLVVAGRIVEPKTEAVTGFLMVLAPDTGKKVAEYPLETVPVYDGLALAGQRVYLCLQNGKVLSFGKAD